MKSPKSFRLHIGIFGRRNTGKSSIMNILTNQYSSIVSEVAGTTTDPIEKPMEMLPLGPVIFIDTAGIDDEGELGRQRIEGTRQVFERTDIGIIVTNFAAWGKYELNLSEELRIRDIPQIIVFNKIDLYPLIPGKIKELNSLKIPYTFTSATMCTGIDELRQIILQTAPPEFIDNTTILADLAGPGETVILVVPIDKEAPKGRLILPQVQCIRDLLDHNSLCIVVRDHQLPEALNRLNAPPKLVVTDSQAFESVAAQTPKKIPLTSFSILFARFHGDLNELVKGAMSIKTLIPGDKVLIAEACTHHPVEDDIATVKIPAWLNNYIGGNLLFEHVRGRDFPENLKQYKLIVHCGACMWNRRSMISRILKASQAKVPITNYGLAIAWSLNIFERALQPFPAAMDIFKSHIHSS